MTCAQRGYHVVKDTAADSTCCRDCGVTMPPDKMIVGLVRE